MLRVCPAARRDAAVQRQEQGPLQETWDEKCCDCCWGSREAFWGVAETSNTGISGKMAFMTIKPQACYTCVQARAVYQGYWCTEGLQGWNIDRGEKLGSLDRERWSLYYRTRVELQNFALKVKNQWLVVKNKVPEWKNLITIPAIRSVESSGIWKMV